MLGNPRFFLRLLVLRRLRTGLLNLVVLNFKIQIQFIIHERRWSELIFDQPSVLCLKNSREKSTLLLDKTALKR